MDIQTLTDVLMWCTLMNFVLLCLFGLIMLFGANGVYRLHSKWFSIPRETFDVLIYSFLGIYKFMFFFFNLIPFLALLLAT